MAQETFVSDFKRFFFRGLAAVLPTLLTVIVIVYVFRFVNERIGQYITISVSWLYVRLRGGDFDTVYAFTSKYLWWVGFLLAIVGIYLFGRFVGSFLGVRLWRALESAIFRMPMVKQIYPSIKQVTDFLLTERKMQFSRVVAVEYPRKGIWSLGLVTAHGMRTLQGHASRDLVTVFIPSSPTPFTGYTITVRRDEVIDLPLSIDEALRFTISGGVIMPENQKFSDAEVAQLREGVRPPNRKEISA